MGSCLEPRLPPSELIDMLLRAADKQTKSCLPIISLSAHVGPSKLGDILREKNQAAFGTLMIQDAFVLQPGVGAS